VIYVEAGDEKSILACFEEGLRHGGSHGGLHGGLGAVVAEVARLSMTASRRLQLAAEGSGAIGIAIQRFPYMRERVIRFDVAADSSPPPCGEGAGVGVGRCGTSVLHGTTPHPIPPPQGGRESTRLPFVPNLAPMRGKVGRGEPGDFGQPTAAVTRWRVSALPSHPLPVPGIGRARWRLELVRCRGGESACFEVEACDAQGRLALPSDLVHGSGQKAIGRRRTVR
jgi:hypothetical protein